MKKFIIQSCLALSLMTQAEGASLSASSSREAYSGPQRVIADTIRGFLSRRHRGIPIDQTPILVSCSYLTQLTHLSNSDILSNEHQMLYGFAFKHGDLDYEYKPQIDSVGRLYVLETIRDNRDNSSEYNIVTDNPLIQFLHYIQQHAHQALNPHVPVSLMNALPAGRSDPSARSSTDPA